MLQPCQNDGSCFNNDTIPYGFNCLCLSGFSGAQCEFDDRPCKPDTCWNNGMHPPCFSLKQSESIR